MTPREDSIEAAIVAALQCHGWLVIPVQAERTNGGRRTRRHAMPGTPDLVALRAGQGVLIEVKRPTGKVRKAQALYHAYAAKHGVPVIVARGIEDVEDLCR